ncbi:MAG: DUF4157 domain-containing protein [Planctomycetaceae bacterium]
MKAGVENLSGFSMDGVRVHYGSSRPSQFQALAFAQGDDIFLAPGQERHLPHEAWQVVQQKQGRVAPTMQMMGGVYVNDNLGLEQEAHVMGEKSRQMPGGHISNGISKRSSTSPGRVVQRIVNVTATQYQARVAPGGVLTPAQLREYVQFVLKDDLAFARAYADKQIQAAGPNGAVFAPGEGPNDGEPGALAAYEAAVRNAPAGMPAQILAADGLAALINAITNRITVHHPTYNAQIGAGGQVQQVPANIPVPNAQTRYAYAPPNTAYAHSDMQPAWRNAYAAAPGNAAAKKAAADAAVQAINWPTEAAGQEQFAQAAGATLLNNVTPTVGSRLQNEPRTGTPRPLIRQLSWDQAKAFFPRPLLNLLFDVKSQLVAGAGVIDERTRHDMHPGVRNATSNEPGTLRSWHEDSGGILPGNGIAGAAAGAAAAVPQAATALHAHYGATSRSGAGAAAGEARQPLGFAEYTGAGTAHIHNIKIVLDYVRNRVYLTLSHYQYWAIVDTPNGHEFVAGGSQAIAAAQSTIQADPRVVAANGNYVLMNPWMEILVP